MDDVIRMLRYNTGTDKKAFVKFKNDFDAVIFNATIVAYSGAAVADLVSVHKNQYIIDPQTHILQHSVHAIMSKKSRNGQPCIKKICAKISGAASAAHSEYYFKRKKTPFDCRNERCN